MFTNKHLEIFYLYIHLEKSSATFILFMQSTLKKNVHV